MAKRKKEESGGGGAPGWMATFSDLMNLLLCFFVLLFSMSSVDAAKFEAVVASLQSSFSILPAGGSSVGDAGMISSGISQLKQMDVYYNPQANSAQNESDVEGEEGEEDSIAEFEEAMEALEQRELSESEKMADEIEELSQQYGIQDQLEVSFNAQYVQLTLNGAILFDSGSADLKGEAVPLIDKIGLILQNYQNNVIEIEGHTDNVPIHSAHFESNDVLSMYRALSVADYIRSITTIPSGHIKSSGRGEYVPVADNTTPEGRARNRRVEIKIYNSFNSENLD
ncbi:MAG: flagellar motor protein MotB [Lachnospiraceae bacterium]|nr:flagellar motor protein MotB [Lachnospiraceae bacterium]